MCTERLDENIIRRSEGIFARHISQTLGHEAAEGLSFDFVIDTDDPQELEMYAAKLARIDFKSRRRLMMHDVRFSETVTRENPDSASDGGNQNCTSSSPQRSTSPTVDLDTSVSVVKERLEKGPTPSTPVCEEASTSVNEVTSTTGNLYPGEFGGISTIETEITEPRVRISPVHRSVEIIIPSPACSIISNISNLSVPFSPGSLEGLDELNSSDILSLLTSGTFDEELTGESDVQPTQVNQPSPQEKTTSAENLSTGRGASEKSLDDEGPSSCIPNLKSRAPLGASLKRLDIFRTKRREKKSKKDSAEENNIETEPAPVVDTSRPYNLRPKNWKKKENSARPKNFQIKSSAKKAPSILRNPKTFIKSKSLDFGPEPIVSLVRISWPPSIPHNVTSEEETEVEIIGALEKDTEPLVLSPCTDQSNSSLESNCITCSSLSVISGDSSNPSSEKSSKSLPESHISSSSDIIVIETSDFESMKYPVRKTPRRKRSRSSKIECSSTNPIEVVVIDSDEEDFVSRKSLKSAAELQQIQISPLRITQNPSVEIIDISSDNEEEYAPAEPLLVDLETDGLKSDREAEERIVENLDKSGVVTRENQLFKIVKPGTEEEEDEEEKRNKRDDVDLEACCCWGCDCEVCPGCGCEEMCDTEWCEKCCETCAICEGCDGCGPLGTLCEFICKICSCCSD